VVKSLSDLGLDNNGSLQAKSHQSYDKATSSIEKGQKWYAVTGYQVPPHQLQASITRAKDNWRTYVPGQPYEAAPIGDIHKFLRKDIRDVGRGLPRPRPLLHYAEHHEIHKLNALIHDVALLNDETPSKKHQATANLDSFFPRTRTMGLDNPNRQIKSNKKQNTRAAQIELPLNASDKRNRQGKQMVFITRHQRKRDHVLGLVTAEDGTTLKDELSAEWCMMNFNPKLLEVVKLAGPKYPNQKKWVWIPAGKSRENAEGPVVFVDDIQTQYQQGSNKTCMIHSFCSVLHYAGLAGESCKLQQEALEYEQLPVDAQMGKLATHL
jgi:hypothetical protein